MGYLDRFSKGKYKGKTRWQKIWYFIWHEDSVESWVINIILAFILIKYLIYPVLCLLLGTSYPIVAVFSSSRHHDVSFDTYWGGGGEWYLEQGITKEEFMAFPMHNGFNKGDIMVLLGRDISDIQIGDIIVFQAARPDPIIHRVVDKRQVDGQYSLQTKGDNYRTNPDSINSPWLNELDIREEQLIGKAFIRVPYLGYIKIWAVEGACMLSDFAFCIR
jgi:signal peptidase I